MASSKTDKPSYGPGVFEVLFGVVLSLLLGAVLAVCYLIVQPVQIGKTPAKDEPASQVTYITGTQDANRGKQWLRKKQLFTERSSVEVNEDELNAWITAGTAPEPPKAAAGKKPDQPAGGKKADQPAGGRKPDQVAGGKRPDQAAAGKKPDQPPGGKKPDQAANGKKPDEAPPAAPVPLIQLGTPNFHISDGLFQIGSEAELNLDIVGFKQTLILQASGRFVKGADGFAFAPERFYVGCCPLHKLPGLSKLVLGLVLANEKIPEDLSAAWKKLAVVSVEGSSLKLTMP
jgi:hypothetical protein